MEQFQEETSKDAMLVQLKDAELNGWPQRKQHLKPSLQLYWSHRDEISMKTWNNSQRFQDHCSLVYVS